MCPRNRMLNPVEKIENQPENSFASIVSQQQIVIVSEHTLESGVVLHNVPVAYTTKGTLCSGGDNAMVICHALSGSADVADWWGPLIGTKNKAFDISRFFIVCLNSLGSPYGTASPVTNVDGDPSRGRYGPEFPLTTIRDDVNLHRRVLDWLGVKQIAAAVGGSMGGMLVLEYAYFGTDYVRTIVPIATSARHSAWGISWGEAQRQTIYCDPKYEDGYYSLDDPPVSGLGAARMQALLTYRSRDSFESRFGRQTPTLSRDHQSSTNTHLMLHNDGHKSSGQIRPSISTEKQYTATHSVQNNDSQVRTHSSLGNSGSEPASSSARPESPSHARATTHFSAQSYLRYQATKFVKRFDSNCYIAITRKLDTHDVSRSRIPSSETDAIEKALAMIKQSTLVLGIESDGLFQFAEQQQIAHCIPNARLREIKSPEGHDAFLLQFEQVNRHILEFFHDVLPDIMLAPPTVGDEMGDTRTQDQGGAITRSSTFGEAEVGDITAW